MKKESMSSRERWLAVLNRKPSDRIPMDYQGTPEVLVNLKKHLGLNTDQEVWEKLHIDMRYWIGPDYTGPALAADHDEYGIQYRMADYGSGSYWECVSGPLEHFETIEEIERNYVWPTHDHLDYSRLQAMANACAGYPVSVMGSEPFLTYKYMRGEEQAFMDLVLNPDIVHYCLGKLYDIRYVRLQRILESVKPGTVDLVTVAEDMGSQTTLLYSPAHIREFFVPHFKRMTALAHQHGAKVLFHSDGAIRQLLEMLIECGVDIINPVQWRCPGMEREGLKNDFGDRLIFHGATDNQQTLPFGYTRRCPPGGTR